MHAQTELIALLDQQAAVGIVAAEEGLHHGKGLGGGNHHCFGVSVHEGGDVGRVVRLHVLHDQIVGRATIQRGRDVFKPLIGKMLVHGIHDGDFLVQDGIRIVCHTVGYGILALKKI